MASARKTVELFYDVISPYSWVAFEVLCRAKNTWNINLKLKPLYLMGVFSGSDNVSPALNAAKGPYLFKDMKRVAEYYHVPLRPPTNPHAGLFKKGTLTAMRYVTAVDDERPDMTEAISRELWLRTWNKDKDVSDLESLAEAGREAGLAEDEINSCLQKAGTTEVKDKLKAVTQEALDHGAFGAPVIIAHDAADEKHMIFGSDRFHILAHILGEREQGALAEFAHPKMRQT